MCLDDVAVSLTRTAGAAHTVEHLPLGQISSVGLRIERFPIFWIIGAFVLIASMPIWIFSKSAPLTGLAAVAGIIFIVLYFFARLTAIQVRTSTASAGFAVSGKEAEKEAAAFVEKVLVVLPR